MNVNEASGLPILNYYRPVTGVEGNLNTIDQQMAFYLPKILRNNVSWLI